MNHTFEVEVAMLKTKEGKIIGTDCAIFLCDLAFWCNCNRSSGSNFHDGRYWTFSTMEKLCERHPYWTKGQMRRIIDKCKSAGFIITGNYNKSAYDRTLWYSVSDEILSICKLPGSENSTHKKDKSICTFEQMETLKNGNESAQKYTPIPNSKTDIDTDIIPPTPTKGERDVSLPKYKPELFERFWKLYPRKTNRQQAVKAWDKLKPSFELCATMSKALHEQITSEQWQDPNHIPHASTWLNNARWTDELPKATSHNAEEQEKPKRRTGHIVIGEDGNEYWERDD